MKRKRLAPWEKFPLIEPHESYYDDYAVKGDSERLIWSDKIIDPEEMWRYTWAAVNLRVGRKAMGEKWWLHNNIMPGLSRRKDYKHMHPKMVEQFTDKRCLSMLKKIMKINGQFGPCCQGHFPSEEAIKRMWSQWMRKRVSLKKGTPMKLMNPWTGGTERYSAKPLKDITISHNKTENMGYTPRNARIYVPAYLRFSDFRKDLIQYNGKGAFIASIDTLIQDFKTMRIKEKLGYGQSVSLEVRLDKQMQDEMPQNLYHMLDDKKRFLNRFFIKVVVQSRNDEQNKACWELAEKLLDDFIAKYYDPAMMAKSMYAAYGEQARKIAKQYERDPFYLDEQYGRQKFHPKDDFSRLWDSEY